MGGPLLRIGVTVFPGSNCDRDALYGIEHAGAEPVELWHTDATLKGVDAVVVPGGFSYGDYLRPGAIARFAGVMGPLEAFAREGGPVLGICNGFQVLCEAGLLPGALVRNAGLSFICEPVHVRVEKPGLPFTMRAARGDVLTIPIKHGEGRYVVDPVTLASLEERNQIVLRYCNASGEMTADANPNGSTASIAGVCNERGNVFGMMPHPEHAVDPTVGIRSADGAKILGSLLDALVPAAR